MQYFVIDNLYDMPKEKMNFEQFKLYNKIIEPRLKELEKTESDITYELYMKRVKLTSFINYLNKMVISSNTKNINRRNYIMIVLLIRFLRSIDKYDTNVKNVNKLKFVEFIFKNDLTKFENRVISGKLKFGEDF